MNLKKLFILTLLLVPGFLLTSCDKDDDKQNPQPAPAVAKCLLTEVNQDSTYWQKRYFDANDLLVKYDWKYYSSLYTTTYVYNSQNQVVEQTQVQTNGPGYFYMTYTYNNLGRWQKRLTYTKQNGAPVLNRTTSYTYSPSGQLQRKDEDYNLTGDPSTYTTYSFTNNKVVANSYSNSGVLYTIEEFEFDNNKVPSADVIASTYGNEFFIPHNIIKYTLKYGSGVVDRSKSYTATLNFNPAGYPTTRIETNGYGDVRTETYTYSCK
ncbi:hypothetical protein [Adhaeribacter soli]|uniref:DUF4595 domain-containing protein n=1 Tax=Adhaeribacter soli TaxID=2607655 RepID=A0A5N1J5J1_9BACT|nr:hypothetical protein [Adhaeribacter soli]KAA9339962.1 hypothetical protein F0P94_06315 [Adhaeribacter soli]